MWMTRCFEPRTIRRSLLALAGAALVVGSLTACGHGGTRADAWGPQSAEEASRMRQRMMDRATRELALDA
ncbi:MAG: hypothetical protein RL722_666, partial [Pseudomonadota bacterium]